jgi:uncharacterized protein (UPF0276 family)
MFKDLGVGVGLRPAHHEVFLNAEDARALSPVRWVEVISENFMPWKNQGQASLARLLKVREMFPVFLHGVSLSIGSAEDLNFDYLHKLKVLADTIQAEQVSDHLCWTGLNGENSHDLLPVPYTNEALNLLSEKITDVQETLGRRILLENPSSYLDWKLSDYSEAEFLSELVKHSGCGLLLDINNVFVSAFNHGFDAKKYLQKIPHQAVGQIHLAGHASHDTVLVDTHDAPVRDEVWDLYRWYLQNFDPKSTMIERDGNIPEWDELRLEVQHIQRIQDEVFAGNADRVSARAAHFEQPGL